MAESRVLLAFYDPYLPAGAEKGLGGVARYASFHELIANCDAISFHCPLTDETAHMLNRSTLPGGSHPGLFVVNCARGGYVE